MKENAWIWIKEQVILSNLFGYSARLLSASESGARVSFRLEEDV